MNEYRCTRPYVNQSGDAKTDLSARQGHYIYAEDEAEARRKMAEQFPEDVKAGFGFDVQLWKVNVQLPVRK